MSLPPPPGSYGQQPPTGGQPGGGAPQPWSQQPYPGGPSGPPPSGPPPWGPQQQWAGGPPPPSVGGKTKWILGGLAAILAIALVVVITVLVVRPDGSGNGSSNAGGTGSDSEFASANDTAPANIITEDPTCEAWVKLSRDYADSTKTIRWADRDSSIPASAWTPDQRAMFEAAGRAMTRAADQTVNLVKRTPHRTMRELYEQFIAYTRDFVKRIPSYAANDDNVVAVANAIGNGLNNVCSAISFGSAPPVAPLIAEPGPPSKISPLGDPKAPALFLNTVNSECAGWSSMVAKFSKDTEAWLTVDAKIPATEWTSEQKAINDAVIPIMEANADELERLGRASGNPTFEDIAILAAQYQRAYVTALPAYTAPDGFLAQSASFMVMTIDWACKAAS